MSEKNDCGNCANQMSGFDGGFCGLPFTCECRIYGETENRKNCSKFEKRLTKYDLLMRISELEEENEQLKKGKMEALSLLREEIDKNEQLQKELDNFKPVMFQDVRKGTVILYSKGKVFDDE